MRAPLLDVQSKHCVAWIETKPLTFRASVCIQVKPHQDATTDMVGSLWTTGRKAQQMLMWHEEIESILSPQFKHIYIRHHLCQPQ